MMKFLVLRAAGLVSKGLQLDSIVTAKQADIFTAIDRQCAQPVLIEQPRLAIDLHYLPVNYHNQEGS